MLAAPNRYRCARFMQKNKTAIWQRIEKPALQGIEWVVWPGAWPAVTQDKGEHNEKRSAARVRSIENPV
jgi:hypothetical protein